MAKAIPSSRLGDPSSLLSRTDADISTSSMRHLSTATFSQASNNPWATSSIWGNGKPTSGFMTLSEHTSSLGDISARYKTQSLVPASNPSSTWNRRSSDWNPSELEPIRQLNRRASDNPLNGSSLQNSVPRSSVPSECLHAPQPTTQGLSGLRSSSSLYGIQSSSTTSTKASVIQPPRISVTEARDSVQAKGQMPYSSTRHSNVGNTEQFIQFAENGHAGHALSMTTNDLHRHYLQSPTSAYHENIGNDNFRQLDTRLQPLWSAEDAEDYKSSLAEALANVNRSRYWPCSFDESSKLSGWNNASYAFPQSPPQSADSHSPNYIYAQEVNNRSNLYWPNASADSITPLYAHQIQGFFSPALHYASRRDGISDTRRLSDGEVSPGTEENSLRVNRNHYSQHKDFRDQSRFNPRSPPFIQGPPGISTSTMTWPMLEKHVNHMQGLQQSRPNDILVSPQSFAQNMPPGVQGNMDWRTLFLEDFKNSLRTNAKNRRFELNDIRTFVAQVAGDQNGSRFIQERLETAKGDEKDFVFAEVLPNAKQLMMDVFGNYVCQKFFEFGTQLQKRQLAEAMKGHMLQLSRNTYACRVVQKALEHILLGQQIALVNELKDDIVDLVRDANANHVVQVAISRVPIEHIQFIVNTIVSSVQYWAIHNYGCRVVQRLLEQCVGGTKQKMLEDLHSCAATLIADQYGNYVAQRVIIIGSPEDRGKIINVIKANLLSYSRQKYASNTVEKGILFGSDQQRKEIMLALADKRENGESVLPSLVRDQYGNYVIQTLLEKLAPMDRIEFIRILGPEIAKVKMRSANKQSESVESKMHKFEIPRPYLHSFHAAPGCLPIRSPAQALTISTSSTPALTSGSTPTPRSSSFSSAEDKTLTVGASSNVTFRLEVARPTNTS